MLEWHHADIDNRMYINIGDGKKAAMPRYYKDKLYNKEERERVAYAQQKKIREKLADDIARDPDPEKTQREREQAVLAAYNNMFRNAHKGKNL